MSMAAEEKAIVQASNDDESMLSFVMSVDEAKRRVEELQRFVREVMVPDQDYGTIPGTPKPTLLKPGAEKLCEIYGLAPTIEVTNRVEDWEKGFFHYECKCRLVSKRTGIVVAEGVGSANTRERRYRNQDPYTLVNTVLKMAKKRALVDATLSATRSSGLFVQDVEDIVDVDGGPVDRPRHNGRTHQQRRNQPTSNGVTREQLQRIGQLVKELGWSTDEARAYAHAEYGVSDARQLTREQAEDLIGKLEDLLHGADDEQPMDVEGTVA
ncbi:MAG TPA: hypothetical protein VIK75_09740 [Calditerricola sp.]